MHPDAVMPAHLAACAAGKQGKFLAFKNAFWEKGYGQYKKTRDAAAMNEASLMKIAASIGLDTKKLATDMKGDECRNRIKSDIDELNKFGVSGTPSFYVNGKFTMFAGPGPFMALVDTEIAAAEKSGVPAAEYYQKVVIEKGEKTFRSLKDARAAKKAAKSG